ncbi:hypothetical protein LEP1GSC186_2727 [Leptospira noguchii serovar Autumnalis str. ZUN142]|uniref:Leucine rich repeat protein n=1 Tax=Leptospira noguchii serovar Autumnalis str. ZUN142 TaxID=1085540 RepID=M6U744_9LEPT|nr:hypothetical protein LEP1GSC186_2727 [Leptospira noguchii serovar Autumnalis str. ZUN142]
MKKNFLKVRVPTKLRRILEFITFSESLSVIKIVRVPTKLRRILKFITFSESLSVIKIVRVPTKLRRILEFITFSESLSVIKIVRVPTNYVAFLSSLRFPKVLQLLKLREFGITNAKAIIMLRSIVSSIEFEKFRRNWSEKNSMKRFLRKRFRS